MSPAERVDHICTRMPHKTRDDVEAFVATMTALAAAFNAAAGSSKPESCVAIGNAMDDTQLMFTHGKSMRQLIAEKAEEEVAERVKQHKAEELAKRKARLAK
jgi:hypothetical protein